MAPQDAMQGLADAAIAAPAAVSTVARPEQKALVCFATDAATEAALREGLADAAPADTVFERGDIAAAIRALRRMPTPATLIVDVSGTTPPFAALDDLAQVVEPGARVLVVGDDPDLELYRRLVRGMGILEYLVRPLTAETVARYFAPVVARRPVAATLARGGHLVAVTGVRGGVGATTIAANLAWYLGEQERRHTVLFDAELQFGNAALLLGTRAGAGLRAALEAPDRIDELLVDRAVQRLHDRLHVLAAEEDLTSMPDCAPGAAERLLETLQRRYSYIVLDVPFRAGLLNRRLLELAHQRVLVAEPGLAACRDTLRLLSLPPGPMQTRPGLVVLNRMGRAGGLSRAQAEQALGFAPAVVVPDLPRGVGEAATLGAPAATRNRAFRAAIAAIAQQALGVGAPRPRRWFGWRR